MVGFLHDVQVYPVLFGYFLTTMFFGIWLLECYHVKVQLKTTTTHNSLISSIWGFTFYLTSKVLITNIRIELWFVFLPWFMIGFKQCLVLIEPLMSWFLSLRNRLIFSKIPPLEQVFLVFLNFCSLQLRHAMDVWGHVETWDQLKS